MKKIFVSILFLLSTFSCKKEVAKPQSLEGQWKWILSRVDNPNYPDLTPQNTGVSKTYIFTNNNLFQYLENGHLTDSGTFTTGHGTRTDFNKTYSYDSVVNKSITPGCCETAYKISNDTLELNEGLKGSCCFYPSYFIRQ
jgi:hypothetical protein